MNDAKTLQKERDMLCRLGGPRVFLCAVFSVLVFSQAFAAAPPGKPEEMTDGEKAALERLSGKVNGLIAWSTSRVSGKHDIFIMNADGSGLRPLTASDNVDWFSRFSPDGRQVLFVRSKRPWMSEANAFRNNEWDLFLINVDGSEERKVADNACWGSWINGGKAILFARNDKVFTMDLASGQEELLIDGSVHLKGSQLQQPELSPDGKYVAITLRGRMRETGIWDLEKKEWTQVGGGCQINWFPSGDRIYWMNPTGNVGSEIFTTPVKDGKPSDPRAPYDKLRWIDLPGRRSHEYFPKLSQNGKWLTWCATIYGHDHDIYDYEVYILKVGAPAEDAVRLTFHSGNDRWPDIYVEDDGNGEN